MNKRHFNVAGPCNPEEHYMVNLEQRLEEISKYVERNQYFTINRARQYGKTTTLDMLAEKWKENYVVFYISFEGLAAESYQNESSFCKMFSGLLYDSIAYGEVEGVSESAKNTLRIWSYGEEGQITLRDLSNLISELCATSSHKVILMIDEVDQAGGYPIFLSFLGMLRNKYLKRRQRATFQSVILAGVYDIRNLKMKIRTEDEHEKNSPWNVAVEFAVEMSFTKADIAGMLTEYEQDYHTGMNIKKMADLLYDYTSGYPFLVSRLCQLMDEVLAGSTSFSDKKAVWCKEGFLEAVKHLLNEKNTLFESLTKKLSDYPELKKMLYAILFEGDKISFNHDNSMMDLAYMFGFVKNEQGILVVANRIFETRLYNLFLSEEEINSRIFAVGSMNKNQFIENGLLNMELVMEKFMSCWMDLYHSVDERFIEDNGRKFFLLYLKPIINGVGNYYIEAQTRDNGRTDVIVDYRGKQYIIEIKIWHGDEYNKRGEKQLAEYLDAYHAQRGYLLSFNFNKNKVPGIKEIQCEGKQILEVVV